jgi:hypothetical protein
MLHPRFSALPFYAPSVFSVGCRPWFPLPADPPCIFTVSVPSQTTLLQYFGSDRYFCDAERVFLTIRRYFCAHHHLNIFMSLLRFRKSVFLTIVRYFCAPHHFNNTLNTDFGIFIIFIPGRCVLQRKYVSFENAFHRQAFVLSYFRAEINISVESL